MEQLLKPDPIAIGMLGKQAISKQIYRPLTYVLTAEEAEKKIYYNILTHEMIAVNLSELDSPEIRKYFIENWYLVPEEHDDQMLVDECRAVLTLMDSWPKKIHTFHIFTTLDCNARCFYCYEKRMLESNMTIDTASRVVEYIQEQAKGDPVNIVWIGGEPLVNYPIIDFITDGLREKGLQFTSDMFSNGLLFDNALVEKAKNLWNLKSIQITLDGTKQVYEAVKAYVTDVTDPFERVLQNIKSLLGAEIQVRVRLNLGMHNYKNMQKLVDFLCKEFNGERNLYVYIRTLFEIKYITEKKKVFIYELLDELNSKIKMFFGKKKEAFSKTIINSSCMASGREAVTILPDGRVGICACITDGELLGDIYTNTLDVKVREEFGRRFYQEEKCRTCPLYPNCYIVNGCPNIDEKEGCDPVRLKMRIRKVREMMKNMSSMGVSENETGFVQ